MNTNPTPTTLARDERGATLVEFAFVLPVLALLVMSGIDFGYTLLARSQLQSIAAVAVREAVAVPKSDKAARQTALVTRITAAMGDFRLKAGQTATVSIMSYGDFRSARRPWYLDTDHDDLFDAGETEAAAEPASPPTLPSPIWKRKPNTANDLGDPGEVISVNVRYPLSPLFDKMTALAVMGGVTLTSSVVVRNEPL